MEIFRAHKRRHPFGPYGEPISRIIRRSRPLPAPRPEEERKEIEPARVWDPVSQLLDALPDRAALGAVLKMMPTKAEMQEDLHSSGFRLNKILARIKDVNPVHGFRQPGTCAICMADFDPTARERYRTLACGHCFHQLCIDNWTNQRFICPICRAGIWNKE